MSWNRFELKPYEVDAVLAFFMHHLQPKLRGQLMQEFPQAYNKLVETEVVRVEKVSDLQAAYAESQFAQQAAVRNKEKADALDMLERKVRGELPSPN